MNVIISGFTGAGKTSVGRLLANRLNWKFVAGSKIREEVLQLSSNQTGSDFWRYSPDSLSLDADRVVNPETDKQIDSQLATLISASSNSVFDVWFVPWIIQPEQLIMVWLDAPLPVRSRRLIEAAINNRKINADQISAKDERAAQYALSAYGVAMENDRTPFDVVVDTTQVNVGEIVLGLEKVVRALLERRHSNSPPIISGFQYSATFLVRRRGD